MRRQDAVLDHEALDQHQELEDDRAVLGFGVIGAHPARADAAHKRAFFVPIIDIEPAAEHRHDVGRAHRLERRGERVRLGPRDRAQDTVVRPVAAVSFRQYRQDAVGDVEP